MAASDGGAAFVARLNKEIADAMAGAMTQFQAQLLGYENAIVALIDALDRAGALSTAEARSALDAMAAGVARDEMNAPQLAVLRRLSARLEPQPRTPSRRH